jgi:hypothetical protein
MAAAALAGTCWVSNFPGETLGVRAIVADVELEVIGP